MVNDTSVVRIPGITVGGALQVSNTTVVTLALASIAATFIGLHLLNGAKEGHHRRKERWRNSPHAIENKVMRDVVAFASNVNTVSQNLPQIRNMVHTLKDRIKDQIRAYRSGDISQSEFDNSVRNMYPMILNEMGIPANSVPVHVTNKLDATIDRVADKIADGQLPVKVKFRLYKNHPGLAQIHELGRQRALSRGLGNKYGLKRVMGMHTKAGVYLR